MIPRILIPAILTLGISLLPASAKMQEETGAKTIALLLYADWCGSCQVLDPKIKEAQADLAEESVLFITLDHTNSVTSHQAKMHAEALGLGEIYAEHAGRTGYLLLVDRKGSKVLARIGRDTTPAEIRQQIRKSLQDVQV